MISDVYTRPQPNRKGKLTHHYESRAAVCHFLLDNSDAGSEKWNDLFIQEVNDAIVGKADDFAREGCQ